MCGACETYLASCTPPTYTPTSDKHTHTRTHNYAHLNIILPPNPPLMQSVESVPDYSSFPRSSDTVNMHNYSQFSRDKCTCSICLSLSLSAYDGSLSIPCRIARPGNFVSCGKRGADVFNGYHRATDCWHCVSTAVPLQQLHTFVAARIDWEHVSRCSATRTHLWSPVCSRQEMLSHAYLRCTTGFRLNPALVPFHPDPRSVPALSIAITGTRVPDKFLFDGLQAQRE